MKKTLILSTLFTLTLLFTGCSDKEKEKSLTESAMKCGSGKCGSSMANGSALLVKKKMNLLDQMKEEDNRRDCVLKAKNTKALYACVRNNKTERLSTKCNMDNTKVMPKKINNNRNVLKTEKCESGKCSGAMQGN